MWLDCPPEMGSVWCGGTVWAEFSASVWAAQMLIQAGATRGPAVTTVGTNSTVTVIVAQLFNEDPSRSVTFNDGGGAAFPLFTFA